MKKKIIILLSVVIILLIGIARWSGWRGALERT